MVKALPEISISVLRPSSTQRSASYSAGHPMPNNKTGTQPHPLAERLPQIIIRSKTPKKTSLNVVLPTRDKIRAHPPEHRHQFPPPGSLHNPLNQTYPLGADTKNNGNYDPAACEKETPNTAS